MQVNLFPKVCNAVRAMAECCIKSGTPVAKSEVYNETWLLRMVLACIHDCTEEAFVIQNKKIGDTLKKIHKAVRQQWISEGGLEPAFRQEGTTWTDAILGNVKISGDNKRGVKYEMRDASTGVIIVEAKMGSELSSGITNSPDYNQAARNIARNYKIGGGSRLSRPTGRVLSHAEPQRAQRRHLGAKRRQPDCPIGFRLPDVLLEVAGRTSLRHSVVRDRSYSWLRYTVTISISLKS